MPASSPDAPLHARVAGFARLLRERCIPPGAARTRAFLDALTALPPADGATFYWTARIALLRTVAEAPTFDTAFAEYWITPATAFEHIVPMRERIVPGLTLRGGTSENGEETEGAALASSTERLRERDFGELSDAERVSASALFARLRVAGERRLTRRRRIASTGDRLDMRATLRESRRTGFEPIRARTTARREALRPLVFLCDVSGSMATYARAVLHYAHVTARARPRVRAFTFATQLHDVTSLLRRRDADEVLSAISRVARDWGGGTRIGASLHTFNDRYARRGTTRGGTVAILSDGWEREDPARVGAEMARLRRLARRIVWINPRTRDPAYEPLVGGMAAALPYVDALVSGHDLRSLESIADALEGVIR